MGQASESARERAYSFSVFVNESDSTSRQDIVELTEESLRTKVGWMSEYSREGAEAKVLTIFPKRLQAVSRVSVSSLSELASVLDLEHRSESANKLDVVEKNFGLAVVSLDRAVRSCSSSV